MPSYLRPGLHVNRRRFGLGQPDTMNTAPLYLFVIVGIPEGWQERVDEQFHDVDGPLKDVRSLICYEYEGNLCGHVQLQKNREADRIMLSMTLEHVVAPRTFKTITESLGNRHECFVQHEDDAMIGYQFNVTNTRSERYRSLYMPEKKYAHHPCCEADPDAAMGCTANLKILIRH